MCASLNMLYMLHTLKCHTLYVWNINKSLIFVHNGYNTRYIDHSIAVLCPSLTDPTSGSIVLTTSGTLTTATYTCASDYNLNGSSQRLCYPNGTWSLVDPTCSMYIYFIQRGDILFNYIDKGNVMCV